ncbi:MAG: TerB N-terminal domain-containing protein, partial [Actinomycetota bacterium]|nr:TerB N-terminal domain-containing protein [Actinomycetota bacterium]
MNGQRLWVPPGQSVCVAGHDIPGGLIYVGQQLRSAVGTIEPALINPALPVGQHQPNRPHQPACDLGPAPSYHLISPAGRAAYLGWLTGGRDCAGAPVGCVSLFFAGLERRVLVDLADDPAVTSDAVTSDAVTSELRAIVAEVRRLQAVHVPASHPFTDSARAFLEVLDLLTAPAGRPGGDAPSGAPPACHSDRWPVPVALRAGLARFAVTGTPVPADWARSWAWYHPALFPRTPQTRCPQEYDRLFAVRYARRFTAGLVPQSAGRPPVRIGYRPASPGIDAVVLDRRDLPDVLEEPRATRELGALADSVTDALTPYSRWLARTPGGLGSLASTALLPAELIDQGDGPLQQLMTWANAHLDGQFAAVIDASEFSAFWSTADPARMSRDEAESLALVLHRTGLGVEPDVRFGGPALAPGPVVLFRLDRLAGQDLARSPSPGYLAATTLLQLAAIIVAAAR